MRALTLALIVALAASSAAADPAQPGDVKLTLLRSAVAVTNTYRLRVISQGIMPADAAKSVQFAREGALTDPVACLSTPTPGVQVEGEAEVLDNGTPPRLLMRGFLGDGCQGTAGTWGATAYHPDGSVTAVVVGFP
jgi:hypothetical protein